MNEKQYEITWRNKFLTTDCQTIEEMADVLEDAYLTLRAMAADGIELIGGQEDDYAMLVTDKPDVATKYGLEDPRLHDVIAINQSLAHVHRGIEYGDDDSLLIYGNDGYGTPRVEKEIRLMQKALNDLGVEHCPLTTHEGTWVLEVHPDDVSRLEEEEGIDFEQWASKTLSTCWLQACGMTDSRFVNRCPSELKEGK